MRKRMRLLLSSSRPFARPVQSVVLDSRALNSPARKAVLNWSSPCCRQSLQRWARWHQTCTHLLLASDVLIMRSQLVF